MLDCGGKRKEEKNGKKERRDKRKPWPPAREFKSAFSDCQLSGLCGECAALRLHTNNFAQDDRVPPWFRIAWATTTDQGGGLDQMQLGLARCCQHGWVRANRVPRRDEANPRWLGVTALGCQGARAAGALESESGTGPLRCRRCDQRTPRTGEAAREAMGYGDGGFPPGKTVS